MPLESAPSANASGDPGRSSFVSMIAPGVAAGGLFLYAIGVIRAAGRLHTTGVDAEAVFRVTSLEQHLLTGVALAVQPATLTLVGLSTLMVLGFLYLENALLDRSPGPAIQRTAAAAMVVVIVLFVSWVIGVVVGLLLAASLAQRQGPRRHRLIAFLAIYVLALGLGAFYSAEPLPPAVVLDVHGAEHRGELLGVRDNFVYLHPAQDGTEFVAMAQTDVRRVRVMRAREAQLATPSLLRVLGVRVGIDTCSGGRRRGSLCFLPD